MIILLILQILAKVMILLILISFQIFMIDFVIKTKLKIRKENVFTFFCET